MQRDKKLFIVFSLLIFAFFFVFFCSIHPLVIFDTDDWAYVYSARRGLPIWNGWNPIKVLPEVLMPLVSNLGAGLIYPLTQNYVGAITAAHAFVIAMTIMVYVMSFVLLVYDALEKKMGQAILLGSFFVLFHFLIFRKTYSNNLHLFYSSNITCYYNYVIPTLLNCIIVMYLIRKGGMGNAFSSGTNVKKGILVVFLYLAVFSNLFSNVVLIAYIGGELWISLVSEVRTKTFGISRFVRAKKYELMVLLAWLIAQVFEANGGRANSVGSQSFGEAVIAALSGLWNYVHRINWFFVAFVAFVLILCVVVIARKKTVCIANGLIGKAFLYMLLTASYLILVCAAAAPGYISRPDVILGLAFYGFVILGLLLIAAMREIPKVEMVLPLILFVMACEVNTSGVTFSEINMAGITYEQCVAIDNDIIEQMVEADQNGQTEVKVLVPDFGSADNWPIAVYGGERISDALTEHGVISRPIYTEIVPSKEKNVQFKIEVKE